MTRKNIISFIENNSINKNGVLLIDYNNMIKVIDICEENKVDILGIDVFSLDEKSIQPHSDKSVDFSSEKCNFPTLADYINQLDNSYKQLFFEVVI